MNTASNALSSELFPRERGRRMNGIALVVGLGGLAMPMATALGAGAISWRTVVHAGAVLTAAVAVAGALVRTPPLADGEVKTGTAALAILLRQRGIGWFGVLLMLGAATEASMAGWTSTFLAAADFNPQAATWALSSHWFGLIVGRTIFSGRVDRAKASAIQRAALCGAATILVFVASPAPSVLAAGPFAIGLAIAIIVPTSLAFAGDRYPRNAGTLFGLLLTLAQVGGIVVPALIGFTAERVGLRAGLALLVVNCLLVAAVTRRAAHLRK